MMPDSFYPPSLPEVLTVEQLAERLQVSRATLFSWMQRDILIAGRHYFKQGRVLRFLWSSELVMELVVGSEARKNRRPVTGPVSPHPRKQSNPINWEY
ncbi:hypothetical protein GeomeDRAFT_1939 [Geobacter metallireducens RCH3]|uniref:Helix-turn-helix DNA-binding protein, putative n=1 Tax=Geobacter metallireducens (strain ATCC 53774 / DSM 7210 / GS-15) TaxID=269799 RepID=Q39UQ9_GEOMG|nr:helix-turn-helix DNA-binding protein, putative [Geobacter metallireducens GS-15]EHP86272.1 hypothetical protein GeomeDRAFT_1939 [Geobacter metallireducens RCH3]